MKLKKTILFLMLVAFALPLMAQDPGGETGLTFDAVQSAIYGGIIWLTGYLSFRFPIFKSISSTWYRVAALAIAIGLFALVTGISSYQEVINIVIGFFMSNSAAGGLKTLGFKTPKPI